MTFFEDVLPRLPTRVAETAKVEPAGHIAHFDNDLYFQVVRIGTYLAWTNVADVQFTLFLAPDRAAVKPPMEMVSRILVYRRGYRYLPLGDILGGHAAHANLRRVQLGLGANMASMVLYRQKQRVTLEPDAPPRWLRARFTFLPKGSRDGYRGYDWRDIGRRLLANLDGVRVLLGTDYGR